MEVPFALPEYTLIQILYFFLFLIIVICGIICTIALSRGRLAKSYGLIALGGLLGASSCAIKLLNLQLPFEKLPSYLDLMSLLLIALAIVYMAAVYYSEWKE